MSLKEANKKTLWIVVFANLVAFGVVTNVPQLLTLDLASAVKDWHPLAPAGATLVLVGLLNAQLSDQTKARLVFWRWSNPLPGSKAFTKWGPSDDRIDMGAIDRRFGSLPKDPVQQNKLWYRLYRTVADETAVLQVHREFLLARDIACLALIMAIVLVPSAFLLMPPATAVIYTCVLFGEYLFATRAARVHGARFVCTVLALKGAGK